MLSRGCADATCARTGEWIGNVLELVGAFVLCRPRAETAPPRGGTSLTNSDRRVTMKPVVRHVMWLSILLVLGMAFSLGTVHAQAQGKGDQPTTPSTRAGEMPGQERMEGRGQMT